MTQKIRIAVVDDHAMVRQSIVTHLKTEDDISVVFEACNGRECLNQLKFNSVDIVLLDHYMQTMNGIETLEIVKKRFENVKVIMVTSCVDNGIIAEYMSLGANSYIAKGSDISYLINAIKTVYNKGYYFDDTTSKAILTGLIRDKTVRQLLDEVDFNEKELSVLKMMCDGFSTKEISKSLNMAISTVDLYRSRIYAKANCNNIAQLMKFAIKKGLITIN